MKRNSNVLHSTRELILVRAENRNQMALETAPVMLLCYTSENPYVSSRAIAIINCYRPVIGFSRYNYHVPYMEFRSGTTGNDK